MARKQSSEKEVSVSTGAAAAPVRRKAASTSRSKHSVKQVETPTVAEVSPLDQDVAESTGAAALAGRLEPNHAEIARLAYSYWEARGCQGGCPEDDWARAEQELRKAVML